MKTVFSILFVILGYNAECMKIRAVRSRVIQYLPYNQNTHTQLQSFHWQPPGTPINNNGRHIYSYVNPVRLNMLGGRESIAAYLNNLNRGQVYQSVHHWPSSAIQGIYQNGVNSGYNGQVGQSTYQSWQNSASGSPIYTSVGQSGINPGQIGHMKQSVYQTWQNAGGSPVDISGQSGVNYGHTNAYQNWHNSAGVLNDALVEPGLNTGNIGQSEYQSWQDVAGGRPVRMTAEQSGVNSRPVLHQSLHDSAAENLVDFTTQHSEGNEINISADQSALNSAYGGQTDYSVQENEQNFGLINNGIEQTGKYSENGGDDILSLDQSSLDGDPQPQPINEFNVDTEVNTGPNHSVTDNDLIYSINESKLNEPTGAPLQDIVKDINDEENISLIGTANYVISPDNGGIVSGNQNKLNWADQDQFKEIPFNNEQGISPVSAVTEIDPNNEDIMISVDQSKLNWAKHTPLKDIEKKIKVHNEENVIPEEFVPENDQTLQDNIDNIGLLADVADNGENSEPLRITPENDLISIDDENSSPVSHSEFNEANEARIRQIFNQRPSLKPYGIQPGNLQWRKPTKNISPPVNNVISSICQNPNINLIPQSNRIYYGVQPTVNTQQNIKHAKRHRQLNYNNKETPKIATSNVDYTNPIIFNKEMYSYYIPGNNINKYNVPQPNYYVPTPSHIALNQMNTQSEHFKPNKKPFPGNGIEEHEDEVFTTKTPSSHIIYFKPDGVQPTFATNVFPKSPQPMISAVTKITEYEKPSQLKMTPKQYVYQVTEAFVPELLRLYHSNCDNGGYKELIKEFKTFIDSILGERCEIS